MILLQNELYIITYILYHNGIKLQIICKILTSLKDYLLQNNLTKYSKKANNAILKDLRTFSITYGFFL